MTRSTETPTLDTVPHFPPNVPGVDPSRELDGYMCEACGTDADDEPRYWLVLPGDRVPACIPCAAEYLADPY